MRPSSWTRSSRLAATVSALLAVSPAGADPPQGVVVPPAPDAAARYQTCLDTARRNAKDGLALAEDWRADDGGFPAEHCAAVALIGLKRYAEAATRLEALASAMMRERADLRAGVLEQAGEAWLLDDNPAAAVKAFDAGLSFAPDDVELLIDRAQAFGEARAFDRAIVDLDRVLALDPKRPDALVFRASAYRQTGRLDRAASDVAAALALDPDNVAGLLERGNIRRLKGDRDGARSDWLAVEKLAPGSAAAVAAKQNLAQLKAEAAPPAKGTK